METFFERSFEIRHFEVNKFGEATPAIMLALLEETAAEHCHSINYGLYELMNKNIGWVLVSGALEMQRYPRYKEKITIRTWLSSYSTVKGFRENIIYDEDGNSIGKAKGLWMFFDVQRRRPAPIFEEILKGWSFSNQESLIYDVTKKIEPIHHASYINHFKVKHSEIDMYKHANNIRYLQWLLESIPDDYIETHDLHFIDGRFMSEIQYGNEIIMLTRKNEDGLSFLHTLKLKGTDKICATATTVWKLRHN